MVDVGDSETDLGCAGLDVRLVSHACQEGMGIQLPFHAGMVWF